jgi:hypothetical protein
MFSRIKNLLLGISGHQQVLNSNYAAELADYKNPKVNLGRLQATLNNACKNQLHLNDVEFRVFSQFGDDGIIQFLVQKMPIRFKTFIEFGVEDYRESNTRFLLVNNYWSGFVIDGSEDNVSRIKSDHIYHFFDLKATCRFIDKENIRELMLQSGFREEVGILSVDIDGNDYWIWETIDTRASIVICEYNGLFGFEESVSIPYDPGFVRGNRYPFNFYGTSLSALQKLAVKKGYFFIGCNSAGNNAYFISEHLRDQCPFPELSVKEGFVFPSFSESRSENGDMRKGLEIFRGLDGLPLIDVNTGETVKYDFAKISQSLLESGKIRRKF